MMRLGSTAARRLAARAQQQAAACPRLATANPVQLQARVWSQQRSVSVFAAQQWNNKSSMSAAHNLGCRCMRCGSAVAQRAWAAPVRGFATVTENLGSLGDSVSEGTVVEWVKKAGEFVAADEVYVIVESDKVSVDIRAKQAGVLSQQLVQEGEDVAVGAPLAVFDTDAKAAAAAPAAAAPAAAKPAAKAAAPEPVKAAPAAAPAAKAAPAAPAAAAPAAAAPAAPAVAGGNRGERRVQMSRMRQTIARRLKDAQNINAMLTTFQEVDMSAIMKLRSDHKDEFEKAHGVRLGFMSGFVKAATSALKKFPDVNAVIDGKDVVYRDYVDVSVAVSTPTGLVVPVLRNTENMSFAQVEAAISALGKKAREGAIAMEDMVGGTFTISNGGVYGSLFGTPIINPPQSAILGMHAVTKRAVVVDDQIVVRPVMFLALTYDHRLIDGATAVQFLKHIKTLIEDPGRMLLDL